MTTHTLELRSESVAFLIMLDQLASQLRVNMDLLGCDFNEALALAASARSMPTPTTKHANCRSSIVLVRDMMERK